MTPRAASRALALVLAIALALLLPVRSPAQYMYLDTDGDGVHTAADGVSPSGPTDIGVWLRTNANRDGSPGICFSGDGDLTISSYEVILSAHNGSVSWDALSNAVAQFSNDQGTVASGSDAHVAFGGSALPPGTYHLANVRVTVTSGTPSIEILTSTGLSPIYTTSFGSACSGLDLDNALKLGIDWFDKDGAPYNGAANQLPVMGPVADMTVAEGAIAEQTIHATDPEGFPLTFVKFSGPGYMSVSTVASGPPDPTGLIRLAPDFFSAGTVQGVVGASDGFVAGSATFGITVQNTQRAPVMGAVGDLTATAGGPTLSLPIYADDPDREASLIHFELTSGPPWVSVINYGAATPLRAEGEILVYPYPSVLTADYPVIVIAAKAGLIDSTSFTVHVTGVGGGPENSPPYILGMPDVGVAVGTPHQQQFSAYDPDGDPITLSKASGPDYMTVTTESQVGGSAAGLVTFTPGAADVGGAIGVIEASDGTASGHAVFSIVTVDPSQPGATQLEITGDPGDNVTGGQSYSYAPPSAEFTARADTPFVYLSVTFPGVEYWVLRFGAPGEAHIAPGFYPGASQEGSGGPLLSIEGVRGACSELSGLFEIKQLDIGPDGALHSFWARFEQKCYLAVAGLTGEIRINANADLAVTAPLSRKTVVGDVVTFPVSAVSAAGSAITLRVASTLPEGADFIDYGDGTGTFTWRPSTPLGPTQIVFEAHDAGGRVDRSTTLLSASELVATSLTLFSDPNDPVGQGTDHAYGSAEIQHADFEPNLIYLYTTTYDGFGPYYLYFRAADRGRIVPGVYEGSTGEFFHTPDTPTLEILRGYNPCGRVTGRFDVREATYDSNGVLESFDAYFIQNCDTLKSVAVTGEIRWNAHPPVDVSVPLSRTTREGEPSAFLATAPPDHHVSYSIQGLPVGATFADLGDNTARIEWTPDFAASGVYAMHLIATRDDGPSLSIPLRWNVLDGSRPPVADAGGPYEGTVGAPVAFDGSGSSDPDGTPLYFYWDFGDGSGGTSSEMKPFHTYSAPGEYQVVLAVYNFNFTEYDTDSTTASIHANLPARLFVARGNREIRLSSGKPAWCAQLEAIRSGFNASDVLLSSLVLVSDSTSGPVSRIHVIPGKPSTISDTDGNGIEEVTACFAKQDLQQLFAYVSGKSVERIIVEGSLANGNVIRAVMQIEVIGASGKTSLAATPNPLNPETVLTWYLPAASTIQLRIFDVSGRLVATLANGPASAGYGSIRWKPDRIASGVYYASLETERERRSIRLVVLK